MADKTSLRVALAINDMYAKMAKVAANKAVKYVEDGMFDRAINSAQMAETWANLAGGNALRWGLV